MPSIPSTETPARRRVSRLFNRRILAGFAFGFALLATAIAGFYLVERQRARARWQVYQAEARARGVKLSLQEYVPPPVPDAENFALIPVFEEAFRAVEQHRPAPNPFELHEPAGVPKPSLADFGKAKPLDLAAWQKFFVATKAVEKAGANPAQDVLQGLEQYAPAMEQLRQAGPRPFSRFPVRWDEGVSAQLPHLALIQSAARIYALRLGAHLALGDSAVAYEDFQGGWRLYTAILDEPSLIADLVRISVLTMLENAVWDGLAKRQWGDAELRRIIDDLAAPRLFAEYQFAMGSERALNNLIHDQLREKGAAKLREMIVAANSSSPPSGAELRWTTLLLWVYPTGWIYRSQERVNRYFDGMLTRVSVDPPRIYPEREIPFRPGKARGSYERYSHLFFYLMAPAVDQIERTTARGQANLDETRLGCALERCRLAQGSFPASLEALAPTYIAAVPRDVMNGAPLHYKLTGDGGYLLYSVAWNLRDDGGLAEPKRSAKDQSDWVWSIPP